jgi:DNA-binding beta-propeller fold protein YncE
MRVGTGSVGLACGGSLWVANYDTRYVLKIDPRRRKIVRRISVGTQPREVVLAAGAVWVSNQGSGTVSRIRP